MIVKQYLTNLQLYLTKIAIRIGGLMNHTTCSWEHIVRR